MRKSLFLTLVLSLCVADFGAFAVSPRNARGSAASANSANATTQQNAASANSVARSARSATNTAKTTQQNVSKGRAAAVPTTAQKAPGVAARAATKKALSMGTKVAAATENTAVSQECQNAYYGCMDAFCMLDNAAGGRCQCSDRSAELDAVMDEIMRIDEQSARIATEGVEQIQMGEYANQVNSKAKSVESGIASSKTDSSVASSKKTSSSTTRTLDLSIFSTNNLFDAEEDDGVFAEQNSSSINAMDEIQGKTGDDLLKGAAKICTAQIPAECKSGLAVLQTAYVSKVKSDCIGYENALKQQRSASQQKLLTAQKAIRDAALDEVRRQNRYETAGECAIAFAHCMQTTAECGSDYTGCVTLAAADNLKASVKGNNNSAASYTIKGVVSGADITIAASTMEALLAKKEICASVTKQCVNANKNDAVWNVFLRNAAPALKSAELIAEQNLRSTCIPTVAECFRNACKSQFGEDDESYDMCLSNPQTYKSLCKVQLEPCLNATGGTFENAEESSLWNGLVAMLNSMKVDACTKEVKDCLLSEDRCGKDFSGCIGLDTYSIGRMCPAAKLTACMTATKDGEKLYYEDEDGIYNYVAQIAQGLALNIDNSFLTQCQNAANEAMIKVCGDTESCENIELDLSTLATLMKVQPCTLKKEDNEYKTSCLPDISQFSDEEIYSFDYSSQGADAKLERKGTSYGVYATLLNKPDVSNITFDNNTKQFSADKTISGISDNQATNIVNDFSEETSKAMATILQSALERTIGQIETDPKVVYCKTGREVQGFKAEEKFGKTSKQGGRFPNLTDEYKYIIANGLLGKLSEKNAELQESFSDQIVAMSNKITERVAEIAKKRGDAVEEAVDVQNYEDCIKMGNNEQYKNDMNPKRNNCGQDYLTRSRSLTYKMASYDNERNVCTIETKRFNCTDEGWRNPFWCHSYCAAYDGGTVTAREEKRMPKFQ